MVSFYLSAVTYRFKPSSERRRHPDLAGSAKPGLSSPTFLGRPPRGRGGVEKLRPPSKKTHYEKAFKNVTPPPPEFNQALLRGGWGSKTAKIVSPLALR